MPELKMSSRRFLFFLGVISLSFTACENAGSTGCKTDLDCRAPRICVKGECVNPGEKKDGGFTCQNECDTKGQKQCFGNGWKECQDYNQDGCLEYGSWQKCGPGEYCEKDKCQPGKARGERIAFLGQKTERNEDGQEHLITSLYIINEDGSGLTELSETTSKDAEDFDWSPDGKKIAFLAKREHAEDIWIINVGYVAKTNLTEHLNINIDPLGLDWSPDETKIAFDGNDRGRWDIYTIDFNGNLINWTDTTSLGGADDDDERPIWSPGGMQITFECRIDGNWEICILDIKGGGIKDLTKTPGPDHSPRWSPDGKKIIFESSKADPEFNYDYELYMMNTDGSGQEKLTGRLENDNIEFGYLELIGMFVWSPDGKIALRGTLILREEISWGIFVMSPDDRTIKKVVDGFESISQFSYSPDGKKMAFSASRSSDTGKQIYIVNSDGSELQQLTDFESYAPRWSP